MQNQIPSNFTHLEVHSHYTILGATPSPTALVARAKADGMSHLALTDTNALYGAVAFDKACQASDIQPILGLTLSVASPAGDVNLVDTALPGQLVLLATGPAGYRSLCRLSSLLQGAPDRQARLARGLGWDELKEYNQGLICLSGGREGWIQRFIRGGHLQAAKRYAAKLGGIFGENAYLSLEIHDPQDTGLAQEVVDLGRRFGLPAVAVQPIFYLELEEEANLRLLQAIDRNSRLEQISGNFGDRGWRSPQEVADRFSDFPETLDQAGQIAARCQPALPGGRPIWPVLKMPPGQTADEALATSAAKGLERLFGQPPDDVNLRLQTELAAISRSGYASLFLIVADIVRYARQIEVPVSTRGSVANSLVAYCTGITTVDPIANDLLFERFLNPARANPPDIDLDFCSRRRDEVLAYVRQTYGPEQVALVATVSTLRPKSALRETAKAYGLHEKEIGQLAKRLPRGWHPDPRRRSKRTIQDLAGELTDPRQRRVVLAAGQIVGQPHHLSIHPGGLVITPGPLTDFVPVQWAPKGFLTTQFGHQDIEAIGLPKLDLLGIRALTVLADTADLVRQHHQPDFHLDQIPMEDELTGDCLEQGDTIGVFQCESAGARRTLRQLKARKVFDLAVANAFFKPGPATGGMAQRFIRRYRGEETTSYLHPALEPILASTKGVLLFQEQILRVATEIAGLSWAQADHLRRGMSKFQAGEMAAMQAQFIDGCLRPAPEGPGFSAEQAQTLWEQVLAFAGFGFNRGHATAYADVSYRSAYLKTHWPAAFFCARLADWGGFHHPAIYIAEAVRLGIPVNPPHINHSDKAFTLSYEASNGGSISPTLWMGLGQVRDLRRSSVLAIIADREERPFEDFLDLARRVPLQMKELQHLIQCGALDGLGPSRAALLADAGSFNRAGSGSQISFSFIQKETDQESPAQRLAWERHILGQPVSVHPLDLIENPPSQLTPLVELAGNPGRPLTVAGVRLPGWTGGPGFYLGDGHTFIMVRDDDKLEKPAPWLPLRIQGRWLDDEWGVTWFQASKIEPYPGVEAG